MSEHTATVSDCVACGHPEVVHGGFARPDGSCGYRGCDCTQMTDDYLTADELRQRLTEVTAAALAAGVPFFEVREIVQNAQDRWFSAGMYRSREVITQSGFAPVCVPTPQDPDANDHSKHDHVRGSAL